MKTAEEILKETLPQFGAEWIKDMKPELYDGIIKAMEEYRSQQHEELPGDDEIKDWAEIHAIHCYHDGLTSKKHFVEGYLYAVEFWKNNYASPLLASRDARIKELEARIKLLEIEKAELIELSLTPPKN